MLAPLNGQAIDWVTCKAESAEQGHVGLLVEDINSVFTVATSEIGNAALSRIAVHRPHTNVQRVMTGGNSDKRWWFRRSLGLVAEQSNGGILAEVLADFLAAHVLECANQNLGVLSPLHEERRRRT